MRNTYRDFLISFSNINEKTIQFATFAQCVCAQTDEIASRAYGFIRDVCEQYWSETA